MTEAEYIGSELEAADKLRIKNEKRIAELEQRIKDADREIARLSARSRMYSPNSEKRQVSAMMPPVEIDGFRIYCNDSGEYVVADAAGWIPGNWPSLDAALAGAKAYLEKLEDLQKKRQG